MSPCLKGGGTPPRIAAMLVLIMMVWGINIPVVKQIAGVMEPVWVGTVRLVVAAVVLSIFLWWRDRAWPKLSRRQIRLLALMSVLMVYANQLFFTSGMRLASGTSASLMMALMPILSIVAGAAVFRDRMPLRAVFGLALGFGGAAMLLIHALIGGGWATTVVAFESGWVWWYVLYSAICGTALSNFGWYRAIGRIGLSRASVFLYLLPIFGVIASSLMLGESLGWWHLVGLLMVITGTRLGLARRQARLVDAPRNSSALKP